MSMKQLYLISFPPNHITYNYVQAHNYKLHMDGLLHNLNKFIARANIGLFSMVLDKGKINSFILYVAPKTPTTKGKITESLLKLKL